MNSDSPSTDGVKISLLPGSDDASSRLKTWLNTVIASAALTLAKDSDLLCLTGGAVTCNSATSEAIISKCVVRPDTIRLPEFGSATIFASAGSSALPSYRSA